MKMLCKLQSLFKDEGFIIIILVFIKITSHSSLLSHEQVGMTVPLSSLYETHGRGHVYSICRVLSQLTPDKTMNGMPGAQILTAPGPPTSPFHSSVTRSHLQTDQF